MASSTRLAPGQSIRDAAEAIAKTGSINGFQPAPDRRLLDLKSMLQILNKRKTFTPNDAGSQQLMVVQGNGQFLPAGHKYPSPDGKGMSENQFDRTIHNLKANSALSMLRKENKDILTEALKAESAGDVETAHDLYNDYLNAVQMSFSVIEPSTRKFANGDQVTAFIELVTTKSGASQLVANDVRYKAPVNKAPKAFELSDLIDIADDTVA